MTVFAREVMGRERYGCFDLPEASRPAARKAVLEEGRRAIADAIRNLRVAAKANTRSPANDRLHIARTARHGRNASAMRNVGHAEAVIAENLCEFPEDGTYVKFLPVG